MFRNQSVSVHQFAMVPRSEIPRSSFEIQKAHKTTFDAGFLVPIYCAEVLPGDTFNLSMTAFARLATPIYPIMDNMTLTSFFFFVPYRLIWQHWVNFQGEQTYGPADSISYTIPQIVSPVGGYTHCTVFDYFGLPTIGQVGGGNTFNHSALPLRAYFKIYLDWFKDENLQNSPASSIITGDGPDLYTNYSLVRRGKRKDYFTGALPWPLKGGVSVSMPLGTTAPVIPVSNASSPIFKNSSVTGRQLNNLPTNALILSGAAIGGAQDTVFWETTGLVADLNAATAATINQIRQAFQIQRLLERDARGGTRYVEALLARFGVQSPDFRLQRSEYLGGSSTPININPIGQTSGTSATGTTTPLGTLAAIGTMLAKGHGFSQSFTEHGIVIGLVCVDADLTYQQGLARFWSRSTRYDFYEPVFAMLGEQTILNKEIYCTGAAADNNVFGYQERWAEYRYDPSMITGFFRSTDATPLDAWHLAQKFTSLPVLDGTFIVSNPPVDRVIAVTSVGKQFIFDSFFNVRAARPLPMYSVPGMIDHF
ncbi:major capsid protein [Blackfly microvirus SF02]|uniref:Major capsid protein n=1 Tax=Blackfly microvirus SF02 TaxID=2576452 RepID=A0A4P8PKM1_9VIRU|nr:major capsid protein [Blackfly microvirus SF02]